MLLQPPALAKAEMKCPGSKWIELLWGDEAPEKPMDAAAYEKLMEENGYEVPEESQEVDETLP
eukprot:9854883-Alexandrium_andersonii.AAC.1